MTTDTATTATTAPAVDAEATEVEAPVFEKGTWEHTLQMSVQAEDKSKSAKILAGKRLRQGAWAAISAFLADDEGDPDALYQRVKSTGLSASTASKIKKVAVTARDYPEFGWTETPIGSPASALPKVSDPKMSLNKADALARALTDKPVQEAAEDNAFEAALTEVVAEAEAGPKAPTTVEGMIRAAFAKAGDVDEIVKVIIDVLAGPSKVHNADASQAFIRAFATENGARIKAAKPEKAAAPAKTTPVKAKPAPTKATPVKGKPAPAKVTDAEAEADDLALTQESEAVEVIAPEADNDFDWDDIDTEGAEDAPVEEAPAKPAPVKAKTKATPIRKA